MILAEHLGTLLNFLFVDGSPDNIRLMQEALHDANTLINVHVVSDSAQAMAFLRQQGVYAASPRPDLIFLDLNFMGIDSRRLLVQIKQDAGCLGIPVIILPTSASEAAFMRKHEVQANPHLDGSTHLEAFQSLIQSANVFWQARAGLPNLNHDAVRQFNAQLGSVVRDLGCLRRVAMVDPVAHVQSQNSIAVLLIAGETSLLRTLFNQPALQSIRSIDVVCVADAEGNLAEHVVNVVLLDPDLPDVQGLTAIRRIHSAAPRIPLVVLIDLKHEPMIPRALQEGAVDYLRQGELEPHIVLRSLRYAVERRSLEDALALEQENAQLARAQAKAKSRFLAAVNHELRTPLNGIVGYAQLLRLAGDLNTMQSARVDAMLDAGMHLLQLINGVLDLSEIEAGHIELQQVEFDLFDVAGACLDLVRPAAEAKKLALELTSEQDVPRLFTSDPTRLRQVLLNLLANAVKFTVHGSVRLYVRLTTDRSSLRFEIVDTGPGISVEQRQHLFREFTRLDACSNGAEGTGLGLAIAAQLTALMGGHLGHEDNPLGGSMFWLELPPAAGTLAASDPATAGPSGATGTQPTRLPTPALRILVVDDIAMNRDIAGAFLLSAGHDVAYAKGGMEAVAAVASSDFDAVLMDVRMPEVDGLEATRRIRSLKSPHGRVPIVALTAHSFTEQVAECTEAGMDSHVAKPFTADTLLEAVARVVGERQMQDKPEIIVSQVLVAGGTHAETLSAPPAVPADPACPEPEPDLPDLDQEAFKRTAAFLSPEAVAGHLQTIGGRAETLLRRMQVPNVLAEAGSELAVAAHALAGSAGMFGFRRLADAARRFEYAIHNGAADVPLLALGLTDAIEAALREIGSYATAHGHLSKST